MKQYHGIDFTKEVLVNDKSYIGDLATIDNKEYIELNNKYYFIISKFKKYLDGYKDYLYGSLNEYEVKKYRYSTFQYFNDDIF